MKYRQHLDWHFRQNRRDKDNTRKAQSREWYYAASDWIQFEETEDFEEGGMICNLFLMDLRMEWRLPGHEAKKIGIFIQLRASAFSQYILMVCC